MVNVEEAQFKRMVEEPIPKLITSLAVPTVLSQLISTVYNTADTYFVAQIGTSATAAVGVVFSLMSIIQAVGFGLGMGANSLISRNLGAKNDKAANKYASSAFLAAIIFGIILMIGGLLNLNPLMRILGSTETMLPYSRNFAKYILIGAPIMCSSFVLNNVLRSEGHALNAMWGLCAGGILNIILDPIFIFKFNLGISGAAISTVISQTVSFIILLSMFLANKSIVKLKVKFVSKDLSDYGLIIRTGLPTICRQMLGSVASALINIEAAVYGDAAVGAVTIANKIYLLVRNIILGIGQGFQPVAGYNYGAKRKERVKQAFVFACVVGTIISTVSAVIIGLNASAVIGWFRKDDMEVIRLGVQTLYFVCAAIPFMAYSTYVNQLYQSLGFSKQATFLASLRQGICFIPIVLIAPRIMGITGVELAQSAADICTFIIAVPFQIIFFKKQLKEN